MLSTYISSLFGEDDQERNGTKAALISPTSVAHVEDGFIISKDIASTDADKTCHDTDGYMATPGSRTSSIRSRMMTLSGNFDKMPLHNEELLVIRDEDEDENALADEMENSGRFAPHMQPSGTLRRGRKPIGRVGPEEASSCSGQRQNDCTDEHDLDEEMKDSGRFSPFMETGHAIRRGKKPRRRTLAVRVSPRQSLRIVHWPTLSADDEMQQDSGRVAAPQMQIQHPLRQGRKPRHSQHDPAFSTTSMERETKLCMESGVRNDNRRCTDLVELPISTLQAGPLRMKSKIEFAIKNLDLDADVYRVLLRSKARKAGRQELLVLKAIKSAAQKLTEELQEIATTFDKQAIELKVDQQKLRGRVAKSTPQAWSPYLPHERRRSMPF